MSDIFLVAVTNCPSGVAHTYMAAEALERAAKKRNIRIKVETQSSLGVENKISQEEANAAQGVILTSDIKILDSDRFEGKPTVSDYATKIIRDPDTIIEAVLELLAPSQG